MVFDVHASAAADLQAIRSLMERATIYEAISAPTALASGVAGVATAGVLARAGDSLGAGWFLGVWIAVLGVVTALNLALLHRGARERGEPFFSSGMKLTFRSLTAPMAAGGVLGIVVALSHGWLAFAAALWVVFYGLALLATHGFAPRPLLRLGVAFTLAGLAAATLTGSGWLARGSDALTANLIMGATFGLLHLVYFACLRLSGAPSSLPRPAAAIRS